jgi:hypothetical protein
MTASWFSLPRYVSTSASQATPFTVGLRVPAEPRRHVRGRSSRRRSLSS